MRTLYSFFLLIPTLAFSQPTILQEHLPQLGDVTTAHVAEQGGSQFLPTGPGAAPQTWNYLNAFGATTTVVSEELVSPMGLPQSTLYPNATLATVENFMGSQFTSYFSVGSEGYISEGYYSEQPDGSTQTTTSEGDVQMPVPFTYGSSITVNSQHTNISISGPGDPVYMIRYDRVTTRAGDAHGTMITPAWPAGVEVVRIRNEFVSSTDSNFVDWSGTGNGPWEFLTTNTHVFNSVGYRFVRAGHPMFVMDVGEDGTYPAYYSSTVTSLSEVPVVENAQLFPNPATGPVTLVPDSPAAHQLEVLAMDGQLAGRYFIQGADRIEISTEGWAAGTYTYRCLNAHGAPLRQGRFVVVH